MRIKTSLGRLAAVLLSAPVFAQNADRPVWVAFDDPVPGPGIVAVEGEEAQGLGIGGTGISNYTCEYFDTCPAGTGLIDSGGNYKGCNASCVGTCTRCSGSSWIAYLCVRDPGSSCEQATHLTKCGKKGSGNCFVGPPPGTEDNNGCGCTVPAAYGLTNCVARDCLEVAGP